MRVLFWSLTFWPNIGGMEVHAARLLPSLRERGHEFLVVAPKNYLDLPDDDQYCGIPIRRLPFQHSLAPTIEHVAGVRDQVIRLKREFAADLVHVNGVGAMDFFHVSTAHVHPAPSLVTLHGDWGRLGDTIASLTLRGASWVAGCSAAILARGRQVAPGIANRSSIVFNGIDPGDTPSIAAVREPKLLYVGRLADEKGADLAIEAFALLAQRMPAARLTVAGEGPLRADLERRAIALGVRAAVDFAGWIVPDRVMRLINEHAAVIMPSRQDSFPLVALEAGAMERPVVASRVGGFPEIVVHGQTGALVEVGDVAGLADACARLLSDPEAAREIGRAARRRVLERFSWSRHVDTYDALYRSLVPQERGELAVAAP